LRTLRISKEIELLLGGIGAFQSVFLTIYIFISKKRNTPNILLACFFLLITIRIIKSLFWVYLDTVPDWFINLGFTAHIASAPVLFLYFLYFLFPKKWNLLNYSHFLPAVLSFLFLFSINENNFWYRGGYATLLYHQIIYTILSLSVLIHAFIKRKKDAVMFTQKDWAWLGVIMIGAIGIQFAYFSNYILGLTPYMVGPIIYGVFVYIIAFFGVINTDVFNRERGINKYQNINIDSKEFEKIKGKISKIMHTQKPYLEDTFTIDKLSKLISSPIYLTSYIINKGFNVNFPDFINSHRIEEAKTKLRSSSYLNIKISEVAYECGFNSISSFNTAFKKHAGMTPSDFRKNNL